MFETIRSDKKGYEEVEYRAENLHFRDVHKCDHRFRRVSDRVECAKCGVGYYDPLREFPVEELNEFFDDQKTKEYVGKI